MSENDHVKELGRYIVADPKICHGKPTFRGTRVMVWQVLEMLEEGLDWDTIRANFLNSFPNEAIAESIRLSGVTFARHADELAVDFTPV